MDDEKLVAGWWATQRDWTLVDRRPDLLDDFTTVHLVVTENSADSLRMFQLLYDAAVDEDERARVVDWYVEYIPWRGSPQFVAWLRERSRFDGEVIRLLDLYEFPIHDDGGDKESS